jgi:hypothetical protein
MLDKRRRQQARNNLRLLIEAYLRDESSMRWGATPNQIRAAAKKMAGAGKVPAPLAHRIRERLNQCQKQSA